MKSDYIHLVRDMHNTYMKYAFNIIHTLNAQKWKNLFYDVLLYQKKLYFIIIIVFEPSQI